MVPGVCREGVCPEGLDHGAGRRYGASAAIGRAYERGNVDRIGDRGRPKERVYAAAGI
jgi:hypothetical protein